MLIRRNTLLGNLTANPVCGFRHDYRCTLFARGKCRGATTQSSSNYNDIRPIFLFRAGLVIQVGTGKKISRYCKTKTSIGKILYETTPFHCLFKNKKYRIDYLKIQLMICK
jgi:hypothetical protein